MRIRLRYSPDALRRDAVAALTVTAIALPQGMAYALLAGVDPRYGLYSTIVVTALASVFGSSSHLINGPTSAISLVVFAALSAFDPDQRVEAAEAMFLLGVMVGSIQILIATFRLGDLTRYISESVILGFMSAAALLLARGQVSNAVGVRDKGTGAQHILHRLWLTLTNGDPVNVKAVITAVATLAFAIAFRGLVRRYRLPRFDMLAALVIVGVGTYLAGWTIQGPNGKAALAVAGIVTSSLPAPHIPTVKLSWARDFAPDSMAIAVLGLLEALAIAKSIANETRQPLDFNRQCLADRQSRWRVLSVPAGIGIVDALSNQLPGGGGNAVLRHPVERLHRHRPRQPGTACAIRSQTVARGTAAVDGRAPDRSETHCLHVSCIAHGCQHRPGDGCIRPRVWPGSGDPDRRRAFDSAVRAAGRQAQDRRAGGRRRRDRP
jgi:hypothetical protein